MDPTSKFTNINKKNLSTDISELHKIRRSADFEAISQQQKIGRATFPVLKNRRKTGRRRRNQLQWWPVAHIFLFFSTRQSQREHLLPTALILYKMGVILFCPVDFKGSKQLDWLSFLTRRSGYKSNDSISAQGTTFILE